MFFKYRPYILCAGYNSNKVFFKKKLIDHAIEFNQVIDEFDFYSLSSYVHRELIPDFIFDVLQKNNILESSSKLQDSVNKLNPMIDFLFPLIKDSSSINQINENYLKTKMNLVDLSGNFSDLEKIFPENNKKDYEINVVVSSNYKNEKLEEINNFFFNEKKSWYLIVVQNDNVFIGPFFNYLNACYSCFNSRIRLTHDVNFYEYGSERSRFPSSSNNVLNEIQKFQVKLELLKDHLLEKSFFISKIINFNPLLPDLSIHSFSPFPICKKCQTSKIP